MNEGQEILLVEDDPRDVRLTVLELQKHLKVRIVVARDGEEALDYLFCREAYSSRSPKHPPSLVLLDLKLPKLDGIQVLRQIKESPETQFIPVIVLTSSREEKDRAESYRLGANSYVQKPVDFDQFRETIKSLELYWLLINQPPPERLYTAK